MSETLMTFLKRRAERSYRRMLEEISDLAPEDALLYATADWLPHEYSIGQNGSIAGIVYHVAAWKQMTLPMFAPGGVPIPLDSFDTDAAPALDDWQGIVAWVKQVGMAWNAEMATLTEEDFAQTRHWGETTLTVSSFVAEMYEHDIQHTSQIEYLKQRILLEKER